MSRIVLGNRGTTLALSQARAVLAELNAEWPDVNLVQRTIQNQGREEIGDYVTTGELLEALADGKINIALQAMENLPDTLPEGLVLAAVTRRLEPRQALVAKGQKGLGELSKGAPVGVLSKRDRAFLKAARKDLVPVTLTGNIDNDLSQLTSRELEALLIPAANLIELDRRAYLGALLEFAAFPTASGQGCLALVVRDDDYAAQDIAYTLQHRPSFDRVRAERGFAGALKSHDPSCCVGALASVNGEGELNLLGALSDADGALVIQAAIAGEAAEAEELGRELGRDLLEQLKQHAAP